MRGSFTLLLVGICLVIASSFFLWHNLGADIVAAGAFKAFTPTQWSAPAYVLASIFLLAIGLGLVGNEFNAERPLAFFGFLVTGLIAVSAGADVITAYSTAPSLAALESSGRWLTIGIGAEALAFAIFFFMMSITPDAEGGWVADVIALVALVGGIALTFHTFTGASWGWGVAGGFVSLVSGGFITWRWFRNMLQLWKNLGFLAALVVGAGAVFIMVTGFQTATADMLRIGGGFLALIPSVLLFRWSLDRY